MIEGTCLKKENLENSVAHSSFKFHFVNIRAALFDSDCSGVCTV